MLSLSSNWSEGRTFSIIAKKKKKGREGKTEGGRSLNSFRVLLNGENTGRFVPSNNSHGFIVPTR